MTAPKIRAKARTEAAKVVTEVWEEWTGGRPDTNDPQFWGKYAAHDEALADAYLTLYRVTDAGAVSMALQDAEEYRRERAKTFRRNAGEASEPAYRQGGGQR